MSVTAFTDVVRYRAETPQLRRISVVHDLIGRYGRIAPVLLRYFKRTNTRGTLRVLDIGAYDRAFGRALLRADVARTYHSLDVDDSHKHEFRNIGEVSGEYDLIAMFELIEHLSYEEVDKLLRSAHRLLTSGGHLFISTPNPFHPTRYFSDASHKQHWPAHDLYALLRHIGFAEDNIKLFGIVYMPSTRLRRIVAAARNLVWRAIGIETRGGLLAIATKTENIGPS